MDTAEGIAIVGMAGRFSGAPSISDYWRLLRDGRSATRWLTDEELLAAGVSSAELNDPNYVRAVNVFDDVEKFDAGFFGFNPKEAAILDPQHRHFLEICWEGLEDAGQMPDTFEGTVGVFAGVGMQAYFAYNVLSNKELVDDVGLFLLRHTGNDKDFLATRVSYILNLQGPSVSIQTACSTSLVAVHQACQSLLNHECDMALAGGITIEIPHRRGYKYLEGEVLSPDGYCRAFDEKAAGTIFGSGGAIVVLRRLEDALRDNDNIRAVIRASAVNNDGAQKIGYLAPSIEGQIGAAAEAIGVADVDPESVSYIEAHGTGTKVGDPIELTALSEAYRGNEKQFCAIGSVKPSIGHLDTAAGVASLIKVVLGLENEEIPATLNFETPTSRFDLANSPFYVLGKSQEWPRADKPRLAAVNSLGVGGTNAHAIVEEAPVRAPSAPREGWHVLALSAKTEASLGDLMAKWDRFLEAPSADFTLGDAAYTTQVGRRAFEKRCAVVAKDMEGLRSALRQKSSTRRGAGTVEASAPQAVFMFPGGGAQFPGSCKEHYDDIPAFREAVDACFKAMPEEVPADLKALMFEKSRGDSQAQAALERPVYGLPALFVLEYALARMWMSWGIRPTALIGHSSGEYAGACLAGVLSLEDALAIVASRGSLMETVPEGAMTTIDLPEDKVRSMIGDTLDIAATNAPGFTVVSGGMDNIQAFEKAAEAEGRTAKRLRIKIAAHSRLLDGVLDTFASRLEAMSFSKPEIPFMSTVRGDWARDDDLITPDYWVRHLRHTVRFGEGVRALLTEPNRLLLEVGPGQSLGTLARFNADDVKPVAVLSSTPPADDKDSDLAFAYTTAGRIWAHGYDLDWDAVRNGGTYRRISLPTYAFEKQHHWIEPGKYSRAVEEAVAEAGARLNRLEALDDWFSAPKWVDVPLPPVRRPAARRWLIFADTSPLSVSVIERIERRGEEVFIVRRGTEFRQTGNAFIIDPRKSENFEELFNALDAAGTVPDNIMHLWSLTAPDMEASAAAEPLQDHFDSGFEICKALQVLDSDKTIRVQYVTSGSQSVAGESIPHPDRAALLGPARVAPREIPGLVSQVVDVESGDADMAEQAAMLLDEFDSRSSDDLVVYRSGVRKICVVQLRRPDDPQGPPAKLKQGGVYLITGGMGGIGLELARYLAQTVSAKLALVGRRDLPDRSQWPDILKTKTVSDVTNIVRKLSEMEQAGAEVTTYRADAANMDEMSAVLADLKAKHGRINGIFHAAGTIDDSPIAMKSLEDAHRVLDPKLTGGMVLHRLAPEGEVDFLLLFSSTSGLIAPPGQIDYVAANAVLDAIADARTDTLAVGWGVWRDIGMAARAYGNMTTGEATGHPLLGVLEQRTDDGVVFAAQYDPGELWVLKEHMVGGVPVLPGTGYLEIVKAAMDRLHPDRTWALSNMTFEAPLTFFDFGPRDVRIHFRQNEDGGLDFSIESILVADQTMEHAHGDITFVSQATGSEQWAAAVVEEAKSATKALDANVPAAALITFGHRWDVIRDLQGQEGTAARAEIVLPEGYLTDLEEYAAHPGMVDAAAMAGIHVIKDGYSSKGVYAPVYIEHVEQRKALPGRFTTHSRIRTLEPEKFAIVDTVFTDRKGNILALYRGIRLQFVAAQSFGVGNVQQEQNYTVQLMNCGIRHTDAPALFARVLNIDAKRVYVSSIGLADLRRAVAESSNQKPKTKKKEKRSQTHSYANDIEADMADLWSDLLGVDEVSPDDDFFDLGGHSLTAVRMFTKIRKDYGPMLRLSSLFQARTLREFSGLVSEACGGAAAKTAAGGQAANENEARPAATVSQDWSPLVCINKGDPDRRPFFIVHGAGGNVLNFVSLGRLLGKGQPVYGLEALGADGANVELHKTIEEMASCYLEAIRSVQPKGPYQMGGYSAGGVIAYEMARMLKAEGEETDRLVMFDTLCPSVLRRKTKLVDMGLMLQFMTDPATIQRVWKEKFRNRRERHQNNRQVLHQLRSMIEVALKGDDVPNEMIRVRLNQNYLEAQGRYEVKPYDGNIIIMRARIATVMFMQRGKRLGWQDHCTGEITVHEFDTDHWTLMDEPTISEIAKLLRSHLDVPDEEL